jgi:hypothetical protein
VPWDERHRTRAAGGRAVASRADEFLAHAAEDKTFVAHRAAGVMAGDRQRISVTACWPG